MIAVAALSLAIWLGLLLFRGGFWLCGERLKASPAPDRWPDVAIVIPARDEAETIQRVVASHAASSYPGRAEIFLVDDGSTDGTAEEARRGAADAERSLTIVAAPLLEPGWSGKLWALKAGLEAAQSKTPEAEYVLLTDADIEHGSDLLVRLVARAKAEDLALVSVMARLDARGVWGGLLIPAFIFFFQKLYPFPLVNKPQSNVAGAAGGVVLIRRDALDEIGGIETIRGALIDDCALAEKVKHGPPRRQIELVLADDAAPATSLRDNRAFGSIHSMIARTAFTQLDYSVWKLMGTLVSMALVYLAGPIALLAFPVHGSVAAAGIGALAWLAMVVAYAPTLRLYDQPVANGIALPFAALIYTGFTLSSAMRHWRGQGGRWKGRVYPAS